MKKSILFIVCFFFLLFAFFGLDILSSYFLLHDNNLETKVILESDYNRLKEEYDSILQNQSLWSTTGDAVVSKVILRDPYYFWDTITILKGTEEGIEKGDILYNEQGYIGQIKRVKKHSSEVELLTNKNTLLSVKIQNSYGILMREKNSLIVKNITSKEKIEPGSLVVTSSFSEIPGDIPVAVVEDVSATSIEQTLIVKPVVSFDYLNYVLIRKKVSYE